MRVACGPAVLATHAATDGAAQLLCDQLHAVADAEDGDAELVDGGVERRGALDVHALRAAGQDDRRRLLGGHLGGGDAVRHDLGVDVELAHPPGDQLRVLRSEVDHQDRVCALHHPSDGRGWTVLRGRIRAHLPRRSSITPARGANGRVAATMWAMTRLPRPFAMLALAVVGGAHRAHRRLQWPEPLPGGRVGQLRRHGRHRHGRHDRARARHRRRRATTFLPEVRTSARASARSSDPTAAARARAVGGCTSRSPC